MAKMSNKPLSRVLVAVSEDAALTSIRWLLIGPDRRVIAEGRAPTSESPAASLPSGLDRCVLAVPGQAIVTRRLAIARARPAQTLSVALNELAQDMTEPAADLHGVMGAPSPNGERLAAAVKAGMLDSWLIRAAELGLTPDVILPDSLLPPPPEDGGWTALNLFDRVAVHGRDGAFTAEPDLAAAVIGSGAMTAMEDDDQITAAVIAAAFDPPLNLLDGRSTGERTAWRSWRRAMILTAAVAAMPLLMIASEAMRFEFIAGALDRRSKEAVRAAWPDAAPDADAAVEARRRLGPLLTGGFSGQTAALFTAIEAVESAALESLVLDDAGEMRAAISHRDYADLERLNAVLADHGLFLTEESVLEENGRMISDVVAAPL